LHFFDLFLHYPGYILTDTAYDVYDVRKTEKLWYLLASIHLILTDCTNGSLCTNNGIISVRSKMSNSF